MKDPEGAPMLERELVFAPARPAHRGWTSGEPSVDENGIARVAWWDTSDVPVILRVETREYVYGDYMRPSVMLNKGDSPYVTMVPDGTVAEIVVPARQGFAVMVADNQRAYICLRVSVRRA